MGKKQKTATRKLPSRGLPKSRRTDEPVGMSDSYDDEIDACKTNPALPYLKCMHTVVTISFLVLMLARSAVDLAVHKQRDMVPLDPDDGQSALQFPCHAGCRFTSLVACKSLTSTTVLFLDFRENVGG
jgi:hypothetical protein